MPKIKIREIKKEIKVTEIKKEEREPEPEELSLEEMASEAPSAREFPEFVSRTPGEQQVQTTSEIQTPSATTEEESRAAVRYGIQEDVSEAELQQKYEVSQVRLKVDQVSSHTLLPSREGHISEMFENRELAAARTQEEKYQTLQDIKPKEEKKKYPWEA